MLVVRCKYFLSNIKHRKKSNSLKFAKLMQQILHEIAFTFFKKCHTPDSYLVLGPRIELPPLQNPGCPPSGRTGGGTTDGRMDERTNGSARQRD